jgi:hypothetical protein
VRIKVEGGASTNKGARIKFRRTPDRLLLAAPPVGRPNCRIPPAGEHSNPHSDLASPEHVGHAAVPPSRLVRRLPARRRQEFAGMRVRAGIAQPLTTLVGRAARLQTFAAFNFGMNDRQSTRSRNARSVQRLSTIITAMTASERIGRRRRWTAPGRTVTFAIG